MAMTWELVCVFISHLLLYFKINSLLQQWKGGREGGDTSDGRGRGGWDCAYLPVSSASMSYFLLSDI